MTLAANTPLQILGASKHRLGIVFVMGSATVVQVSSFKDATLTVGPLFTNTSTPFEIYGDAARGEVWLVSTAIVQVGFIEYLDTSSEEHYDYGE